MTRYKISYEIEDNGQGVRQPSDRVKAAEYSFIINSLDTVYRFPKDATVTEVREPLKVGSYFAVDDELSLYLKTDTGWKYIDSVTGAVGSEKYLTEDELTTCFYAYWDKKRAERATD